MTVYEQIKDMAESMEDELIAQRRDFHTYPEMGWCEMRTSSIIARKLTEMGYEVLVGDAVCKADARMGLPSEEELDREYERAVAQDADPEFVKATKGGMTGVIGILRNGEGPTVAMRFDIDALGVFESTEESHRPQKEGFRSVNEGVMHACGHDGHATIGLGVAKVLMSLKDSICGTVKLVFQPSEEGVRGAKAIVENGHFDDVDYMYGSHISPKKNGADDCVYAGCYGSLATYKYDVTFYGKAIHAAGYPEQGRNALLAAAIAVTNLYAISRTSQGDTRINVGTLHAGSGRNVIADKAFMMMEVRGSNTEANEYMNERALQIIKSAAEMYDCTYDLKCMGAAPSMDCSKDFTDELGAMFKENMPWLGTSPEHFKGGGSEDVAYMVQATQAHGGKATFMRASTTLAGLAHTKDFDFDENVLVNAVQAFCGATVSLLQK